MLSDTVTSKPIPIPSLIARKKSLSRRTDLTTPEFTATLLSSSFPPTFKIKFPDIQQSQSFESENKVKQTSSSVGSEEDEITLFTNTQQKALSIPAISPTSPVGDVSLKNRNRKCSYVISAIEPGTFQNIGGNWLIKDKVGYLPRPYDGTSTGETYAVIAIVKTRLMDLLDNESETLKFLRNSSQLRHVPGIEDLQGYRIENIRLLWKFISYFVYDREVILFTLEPRGDGEQYERYPSANLCLPGGGMDSSDGQNWIKCAKREFQEETGLKIPDKKPASTLITRQTFRLSDRVAMYFLWKIKEFG